MSSPCSLNFQGTTWLALHPWQQWSNAFQPLRISVEETEDAWLQGLLSAQKIIDHAHSKIESKKKVVRVPPPAVIEISS
ncbi:hypothetical protein PCANC_10372 [Puccinia coronata f. sp. avenae]|uniref:Uncharacterized protein n=1 Tax=Puccinia coronata f. sp. avenae TaxID=200324 RepID=A0A2N5SYB8_9BASI|nr:hypothetical protein PCANC_10372 [Puccinia coronata f. sp. avenae]